MPWLQKCLESCIGNKVVVVDNNSTDKTLAFIKENYPEVIVIPQDKNLGFGQANNIGIHHAVALGADAVFLLNQDAYLHKDAIKKLIEVHKNNPEYGILSPVHLNGTGSKLDKNFSTYVAYRNNPDFYSDFVLKKSLSEIYEVPFVNAAGWLMPKQILETVGGFDPMFFHYGEDENYCQRAHYHGFKIGIVPTTFLQHDREDRVMPQIERGSSAYFVRMERSLKLKYGNINIENIDELKKILNRRKRNKLKATLKMNFAEVDFLNKEIAILTKLIPEIRNSKEINKKPQANYLKSLSSK